MKNIHFTFFLFSGKIFESSLRGQREGGREPGTRRVPENTRQLYQVINELAIQLINQSVLFMS